MKLSVSLPDEDVEFLDYYLTQHDLKTRSAALRRALRALRDLALEEQYTAAMEDMRTEDKDDLAQWAAALKRRAREDQTVEQAVDADAAR